MSDEENDDALVSRLEEVNKELAAAPDAERPALRAEAKDLLKQLYSQMSGLEREHAEELLKTEPTVDIEPGTAKYALAYTFAPNGKKRYFVRSRVDADYHFQTVAPLIRRFAAAGLEVAVEGGGRIRYDPLLKEVEIYGYSMQFGLADHKLVAGLIRAKYQKTVNVTHGDYGY